MYDFSAFNIMEMKGYSLHTGVQTFLFVLIILSFITAFLIFFRKKISWPRYLGMFLIILNLVFLIPYVQQKVLIYNINTYEQPKELGL